MKELRILISFSWLYLLYWEFEWQKWIYLQMPTSQIIIQLQISLEIALFF